MQVGTTLTYCIMYCTYRQCLKLLYVLAHRLLFTDLYSVLYLLILFADSSNSTKVLFTFSGIFHVYYRRRHTFLLQKVYMHTSTVSCTCMVSVERQECHALGCTRWTHWRHQVLVASVWRKSPWEDKWLLYHAALGSPVWSLSGGTLPHWRGTNGPTGQG